MEMNRLRDGLPGLLEKMAEAGYSDSYVRDVRGLARRLVREAEGLADWDAALAWADSLSSEGKPKHARGKFWICRSYEESGELPDPEAARMLHGRTRARDALCAGLAAVLDAYEACGEAARKRPGTVRCELSCAASFLAGLEARGRRDVREVTEDDVISVVTDDDGNPAYGESRARHVVAVLRGASDRVEGCERLASLVPVPHAWRKVQPVVTPEEAEALADLVEDRGSGVSLRDRAIAWTLMLTAMRACDVAALTTDSIDWERDVISLTQQKTGAPLELPLPTQVGNAIFEYATGERGAYDDPHVFLSTRFPHGGIGASAVRGVAKRLFDAAGVRAGGGDTRGCHALRRAAITAMLGAGEDRAVVASVAGHASPETTDGYMVASVEGLREHASLDVSLFAPSKGGDEG